MNPVEFMLLMDGAAPAPLPTILRGQFMMHTPNPYAEIEPYKSRGAKANRYFMAELDVLWKERPDDAQRMLDQYQAWGGNHIMTGGPWGPSYDQVFPFTDWLHEPDRLAEYLRMLDRRGIAVSYVMAPDAAPYYDARRGTFDWGLMDRDFTPFFQRLTQLVALPRVVSQWEQYGFKVEMRRLFEWMRDLCPQSRRAWHNPPGHLSPGDGSEEEYGTWASAIEAGITDFYFQAWPPDTPRAPGEKTPFQQMQYDEWDMIRRINGDHSPWGPPLPLTVLGTPLELTYCEGVAHAQYHEDYPDSIGIPWGNGALAVAGVSPHSLDGICPVDQPPPHYHP